MLLRVNRSVLLQVLESVQPGLSPKPIVEQSNAFIFKGGYVITLNGEISCRMKSTLHPEFTGAVQATPLLNMLKQLPEDEISLEPINGLLVIKGKGKKVRIRMESEVLLPVASVEPPKGWVPLPEDFTDAVTIVHDCASDDQQTPILTFLNVTANWIEATDRYQMARYRIKMDIPKPTLVRKDSIKHIIQLDMTEMSLTDSWIHFRNPTGMIFSCLRFIEQYPTLDKELKIINSKKARFPKGLVEAAKRADIFSRENSEVNRVTVEIRENKMVISSLGNSGDYEEYKDLQYVGPPLKFIIKPELLIEITKRHNELQISPTAIFVNGGKWLYVNSLEMPQEKADPNPPSAPDVDVVVSDNPEDVF